MSRQFRLASLPTKGAFMRGFRLALLSALTFLAALALENRVVRAADAAAATPIGRHVASVALPDHHGRDVSLADFQNKKALVLVFLGTECPLAKSYALRLNEL